MRHSLTHLPDLHLLFLFLIPFRGFWQESWRLAGKKSLKKKWIQKDFVSKQGRKSAKSTPIAHTDLVFDDVDVNDAMDYMETDAYMQKRVSTEDQVSTVKPDEVKEIGRARIVLKKKLIRFAESVRSLIKMKGSLIKLLKDEEIARKVQEDWEAEEEMKKLAEEEATKAALIQDFDDIQARIEADRLLAARLQEEEIETFTVEERAKFLNDITAAQRRFLAQQRAAAIRRGKKHADLKNKNFEEIQVLYKEVKRSDKNFIAIGSAKDERQIKEMNEESKDPKKKRLKKRVV
ncbi:hypothetical protein Tco_0731220 [Tanacetum coccineum]